MCVAAPPAETVPLRPSHPRRAAWLVALPVAAALLLGLALRVGLLVRSGWLLEGDDSLSTLMGLAILDGDRPIMLKNQTYAGAWEPYAMAAAYTLFGVSRVAAKLPIMFASLAFVGACWLLAREVAGRTAANVASLLAAASPVYVLVMSLKPWAPYTEVMVLGSLTMLGAIRLGFPRGRPTGPRWAVLTGLAGGLAFWLHPIAVYYLVPAALILFARLRGRRLLHVATTGLLAFLVGALPVWLYNLQTGGATVQFVLAGSSGQTADRLAVLGVWWNADLPRALGLWQPWGRSPRLLAVAAGLAGASSLAWAILYRRREERIRPLDGMLLLLLSIPAIFALSGFGGPGLNPWGFDATGRYAPPIWNGLVVVLGAFGAFVWRRRRTAAAALVGGLMAVHVFGWLAADPVAAFQSPYWPRLPADNASLLAALREQGVTRVWLNHWAAFPLMFDARASGQDVIAYDWYDVQAGGIDRYPEYRPLVEQAERPAFVLVTDEPEPELEQRLKERGVAYVERRAGPYVVVAPISRKVHPAEVTAALDYRY